MKKYILFLFTFLSFYQVKAADYYWVGGSGNWSEIFHWATSSGGSSVHTSVPGPSDNVYFDVNSFSAIGQTITMNVIGYCQDLDWSAATNAPTLAGNKELNIYGSFIASSTMSWTSTGVTYLEGTGNHVVNLNGLVLSRNLYFDGTGIFSLQDSIHSTTWLYINAGTINTNGHNLTCRSFNVNAVTDSIFLNLGTSVLEATYSNVNSPTISLKGAKLVLDADSCTFRQKGGNYNQILCNTVQQFHIIEIHSIPTVNLTSGSTIDSVILYNHGQSSTIKKSNTIGYLYAEGSVRFDQSDTIEKAELLSDITILSNRSVVCDTLILKTSNGGNEYTLNGGSLLKVNDSLMIENGTCENPNILRGTSTTNPSTFHVANGTVTLDYYELASVTATGGASFTSNNTITDNGFNSGWTINLITGQDFYWVGGTGDWNVPSNWSLTSGGTPLGSGDCYPRERDNVFFDANSFSATGQVLTIPVESSCHNMDWTGVTNGPELATSFDVLNIHGSLTASNNVNWNFTRDLQFRGTGSHTIDFDGLSVDHNIYFSDTGTYTLQDSLSTTRYLFLNNGTFNSANHKIIVNQLYNYNYATDSVYINLGTSSIIINQSTNSSNATSVNFTSTRVVMNAPNAKWYFNGTGDYTGFTSKSEIHIGNIYVAPAMSDFELKDGSTADSLFFYDSTNFNTISNDVFIDYISSPGPIRFSDDPMIKKVECANDFVIWHNASPVIDTFVLTNSGGDRTYTIHYNADLTITDSISFPQGDCSGELTLTNTNYIIPGELIKTSGIVNVDYLNLISVDCSGGAIFNATNVLYDNGNNAGWSIDSFESIDLYWVGGTGDYNDPTQWSLTSGGTPQNANGCAPDNQSNVIFDANSFSATGQTVSILFDEECVDMTWNGVLYSPMFSGSEDLSVYGDFVLDSSINWTYNGDLNFKATDSAICDLASIVIRGKTIFDANGSYHLQDSFHSDYSIELKKGGLYSNDNKIHCKVFTALGSETGNFSLGSSLLEIDSSSNVYSRYMLRLSNPNLTLDLYQSTINFIDSTNDYVGIRTYNETAFGNIEIYPACRYGQFGDNSTIETLIYHNTSNQNHIADNIIANYVESKGDIIIDDGCDIEKGLFYHDVTTKATTHNYAFDTLVLESTSGARTYTLAKDETLLITDSISFPVGDCDNIHTLTSSVPGDTTTLSMPSGNVLVDYMKLYSVTATGSATFTSQNTIVDDGNNNGWNISNATITDLYWVGGTGNFNDPTNWALTSGGTPQGSSGCAPTPITNVIFDANSFSSTGQTVSLLQDGFCADMDWSAATNTPTFSGTSKLFVYDDFTLTSGMSYSQTGDKHFLCPDTCSIDMDGTTFTSGQSYYQGRGTYNLTDSFSTDGRLYLDKGTFITNDHEISVGNLLILTSDFVNVDLGNSEITLTGSSGGSIDQLRISNPNLAIDADSCTFILNSSSSFAEIEITTPSNIRFNKILNYTTNFTLKGNECNVDSLNSTGSGICYFRDADTINYISVPNAMWVSQSLQANSVNAGGDLTCSGNSSLGDCVIGGILSTSNDVNFKSLILQKDGSNTEHLFSANDTCSISDSFFVKSNGCFNTKLSSKSATNQAFIKMPTGKSFISNFLNLKGMHAFGGATFNAGSSSSNVGNNTGWSFTGPIPTLQLKFTNICIDTIGQSIVKLVPDGIPDMFWWQNTTAPFDTFNTNMDTIMASTPATYLFVSQYGTACSVQDSVYVFYTSPANGLAQTFSNIVEDEDWFNCTNWNDNYIPDSISDATISSGETVRINAGEIAYCRNLQIDGILELTGGELHVYDNFKNNGSFLHTGGVLVFDGNGVDSIISSTSLTLDSLEINQSGKLILSTPMSIESHASFNDGILQTTTSDSLIFNAGAVSTEGNATSYVDGPMYKVGIDAFIFPVGDSSKWARIGISAPSSGGSNTFKAEYFNEAYSDVVNVASPLNNVSSLEYWQLDKVSGTGAVKVSLYYEDSAASSISDISTLRVTKYDGSNWYDMDSTSSVSSGATGYIVSDYVSNFSPFTFGSVSNLNTLPVEFLSVDAQWQEADAQISWQTAMESNNSHYVVERSRDGRLFEEVGRVESKNSNSNSILNYQLLDIGVKSQVTSTVYYQIKQVDFDGHYAYSRVVVLRNDSKVKFSVSPNPTNGTVTIRSPKHNKSTLLITDIFGREISQFALTSSVQNVDLGYLNKGTYFLTIVNAGARQTRKVVLQ